MFDFLSAIDVPCVKVEVLGSQVEVDVRVEFVQVSCRCRSTEEVSSSMSMMMIMFHEHSMTADIVVTDRRDVVRVQWCYWHTL